MNFEGACWQRASNKMLISLFPCTSCEVRALMASDDIADIAKAITIHEVQYELILYKLRSNISSQFF